MTLFSASPSKLADDVGNRRPGRMGISPSPRVEMITSVQRRPRCMTAEKVRLAEETMQPGMSVSYLARGAGIAPSQFFA
jgi:hypothetical protein